jgi:glycosyltransferase involved in cell wall biosynthesis
MLRKLAIITTHPIQYNDPLFALLSNRGIINIKVFYTWGDKVLKDKYDPGFGKNIQWDIELLRGYEFAFMQNIAKVTGSHHFKGIDNPNLIKEIKEWNPDAILVYGWAFKSHLKVLRYFHKKKTVLFRGDSVIVSERNLLKKIIRNFFLKWVYSHVDKALYVGELNKRYFLKNGVHNNQLVFVSHAIDNERFLDHETENRVAALNWKKELNIPENDLVFLYAGKLDRNKNIRFLLDVFCKIKNTFAHLVIAGNGIMEEDLKKEFGSNKNVHFIPFQNQLKMPVLYRMADIFVLPSLSETWGLGVNEAMICGCALLISDRAGAAFDLVENGKNGYCFNPKDSTDLLDKILWMTENRPIMKTWGALSKTMIRNWNYTRNCEQIEKLVNSIS